MYAIRSYYAKDLQAMIDKENGGFDLQAYDWNLYAEKLRKERYDLDESQLEPYFELFNVLENGVFFAANKLYGLTFTRTTDFPVYNPDMRVYVVKDQDRITSYNVCYTKLLRLANNVAHPRAT